MIIPLELVQWRLTAPEPEFFYFLLFATSRLNAGRLAIFVRKLKKIYHIVNAVYLFYFFGLCIDIDLAAITAFGGEG